MKEIYIKTYYDIPKDYTGKITWEAGDVWYYKFSRFHNEIGPAIIGRKTVQYWIDGLYYDKETWFKLLSKEQQIKALLNSENFGERN